VSLGASSGAGDSDILCGQGAARKRIGRLVKMHANNAEEITEVLGGRYCCGPVDSKSFSTGTHPAD
jgi:hypothetical protein